MTTPADDTRLAEARSAFLRGTQHFEAGRAAEAEQCFAHALTLAPGRPSVLLNLGVVRLHLGRPADALPCLQAACHAAPDDGEAWRAQAAAQRALGHWNDACTAEHEALRHGPADAALMADHATTLARLQRPSEARDWIERALAMASDAAPAPWWSLHADLLREAGDAQGARASYERALAAGADPALVRFYLAALDASSTPEAPPADYVRALFDDYAADFEQHLIGQLHYQGHAALVQALQQAAPGQRFARALDAGCGTGLCGRLLRPVCDWLVGVDLAPAMTAQAGRSRAYDALDTADLCTHLRAAPAPYDLVVAADVFIYIGPLDAVFEALAPATRRGSWLAFTTEPGAPGSGVRLLPSLRYSHSADLVHSLAHRHGWSVVHHAQAPIRMDQGRPLPGDYWVLQRD